MHPFPQWDAPYLANEAVHRLATVPCILPHNTNVLASPTATLQGFGHGFSLPWKVFGRALPIFVSVAFFFPVLLWVTDCLDGFNAQSGYTEILL